MLQVQAAAVAHAVPRPALVDARSRSNSRKMDDRKRSASEYDDGNGVHSLPPAKRQATTTLLNGDEQQNQQHQPEGSNVKFGPAGSPWQVDLAVSFVFLMMIVWYGMCGLMWRWHVVFPKGRAFSTDERV
jgi:hypothetical protein